MARFSAENISTFTNITECPICLETFSEPKALSCFHTFCLNCIRTHGEGQRDKRKIPCPVCREQFKVPQGGYEKLKTNFFVADLLDALAKSTEIDRTDSCQICEEKEVSRYCVECDQDLCEICATNHVCQSHNVITCEEKDNIQTVRPSYCEVHPDKQLELYCKSKDCEIPICIKCSLIDHRQHIVCIIEEASAEFITNLLQNSSHLSRYKIDNNVELADIKQQAEKFFAQLSRSEKAIIDKRNEIKQTVDSHANALVEQLQLRKEERLKTKNSRCEEIVRQNLIIESYQEYVEELTSKGSPCDVTRQARQLLERKEKIVASQEEFKQGRLIKERVTYTPVDVADLVSGQNNVIGVLTFNDDPLPSSEPTRSEPRHEVVTILVTSLDRAEKKLKQISGENKVLNDTVTALEKERTYLNMTKSAMEQQLSDLKRSLEKERAGHSEAKSTMEIMEYQLLDLEQSLSAKEEQLNKEQGEKQKLQKNIQVLKEIGVPIMMYSGVLCCCMFYELGKRVVVWKLQRIFAEHHIYI